MFPSLPKMKENEAGLRCDNDDDSDNSPDELIKITEEPKEKWDCESILSEYFDGKRLSGVIKKVLSRYVLKKHYKLCKDDFVGGKELISSTRLKFYSFLWLFNTRPTG